MNKYVIVNENNELVNIIIWDGNSTWAPPPNTTLIPLEQADFNTIIIPSGESNND